MLNIDELTYVYNSTKEILDYDLLHILTDLNRTDRLEDFLEIIGCAEIYPSYKTKYLNSKKGKIVVIAGTNIKEIEFIKTAESLGISRDRLELVLDYDKTPKYDFRKLRYSDNYSLILFGPMPHSGYEKGDYGSVVSAVENEPGYPKTIRLGKNELKISKTNFKQALEDSINEGFIEPNIYY